MSSADIDENGVPRNPDLLVVMDCPPARTGEAGLREALLQPKFQWQVAEKWWNDSAGPGRPFHLQGEESQQLYLGRVREVIGIALQIAALAATPVASKVKETPHE